MITLRKVVALTATSALAVAGLLAGSATAQSSQFALNTSVKVTAGAPANISGYRVTVNCTLPTSVSQTSSFPAAGGGPIPLFFSLATNNSCTVQTDALPANSGSAIVTVSAGGSVRSSQALGVPSQAIPIQSGTDIVVTVQWPSISVKKVIVGEEITAGNDYQMQVVCLDANGALRAITGNGVFNLKAGATKVIGLAESAALFPTDNCHVAEISNGGAASSTYTSTKADGTTASGINLAGITPANNPFANFDAAFFIPATSAVYNEAVAGRAKIPTFVSAATQANGQTITVTNSFVGDLIVSKVVTGDPKTSIAIYEINVSCNNNGPKETFLLKDRQSKVFTGITTGTSCLVSETRSDGADATYADNSGDNTTDGRVTIKGTASGCIDKNLSSFPDCRANVIVTNSYVVATTTAAATTAAPATAAPATAAPIAPAPAPDVEVLDDEEVVTG